MEISNLPTTEFKLIIKKTLNKLEKNVWKLWEVNLRINFVLDAKDLQQRQISTMWNPIISGRIILMQGGHVEWPKGNILKVKLVQDCE